MQENKSLITDKKEKIKCGNCGNEDAFVLICETNPSNPKKQLNETQMTEKQKYLAHYFEAQRRFSE